MIRAVGLILVGALYASVAFAAQPKAHAARAEGGRFDGAWTIEAVTTVGDCAASALGVVDIEQDRVAGVSGAPALSWGYVESDGTIVARFTMQGKVARAYGRLRAASGSGAWSSSTDLCGGTWRARRSSAGQAGQQGSQNASQCAIE